MLFVTRYIVLYLALSKYFSHVKVKGIQSQTVKQISSTLTVAESPTVNMVTL